MLHCISCLVTYVLQLTFLRGDYIPGESLILVGGRPGLKT